MYFLTIGLPQTKLYRSWEGITTIIDEESIYYGDGTGMVHTHRNVYQATEPWATFEIWDMEYYDRAILYAIIFDSLIILLWRLSRISTN